MQALQQPPRHRGNGRLCFLNSSSRPEVSLTYAVSGRPLEISSERIVLVVEIIKSSCRTGLLVQNSDRFTGDFVLVVRYMDTD